MGAGLAGLRTAEAIRAHLPGARITIIGAEGTFPYNRPPLSKEALNLGPNLQKLEFRRKESITGINWILDDAAMRVDYQNRQVVLRSGANIKFDILVATTGLRPRSLQINGSEKKKFTLRNFTEACELHRALNMARKVVLVGAGFIGCEVAATARMKGIEVAVVAADPEPMIRPLGAELGAAMRRRHEVYGVKFHMNAAITSFIGDDTARGVQLANGTSIEGDLVVEAIGSVPNDEWLSGGPLTLTDGVLVNVQMRATSSDEVPVFAAGDVAKYRFDLFDSMPHRIEHWNLPMESGRRAGSAIAALITGESFHSHTIDFVPSFWSDQYEYNLHSFGIPSLANRIDVVEGEIDGSCVVEYFRDQELVGVVGIDTSAKLAKYRKVFLERREESTRE